MDPFKVQFAHVVDLFSLPKVTVGKLALAWGWRSCSAHSFRTGNHNNAELSTQVDQKLAKTAMRQVFTRTLPLCQPRCPDKV